jgi:hypothetical protein
MFGLFTNEEGLEVSTNADVRGESAKSIDGEGAARLLNSVMGSENMWISWVSMAGPAGYHRGLGAIAIGAKCREGIMMWLNNEPGIKASENTTVSRKNDLQTKWTSRLFKSEKLSLSILDKSLSKNRRSDGKLVSNNLRGRPRFRAIIGKESRLLRPL